MQKETVTKILIFSGGFVAGLLIGGLGTHFVLPLIGGGASA